MATISFNPYRSFSTARFDGYFFTIKNHLCADDYAAAVCAIKSTQLKQYRTTRCVFFNTRTVRRYLVNDLTCAARKTTFKTRKRFHNKQYPPKSKVQPHGSERTHFDTGFNNSNVAMHRQTFIFLLPRQIATVQQKTTKTNSQKKQSKISQSKTRPKHTITNKHEKLSHQSIVKSITQTITTKITHTISQSKTRSKQTQQAITKNAMFLNIKISQTATASEPTANTPLIKTQYNRKKTKQPSRHFEIIIQ